MFNNFLKKNNKIKEIEDDIVPVQSLGEILKNSRIDLKIDIAEISKTLKVPIVDIEHLEKNKIENISKNIYIPGFIISYAKILKLDLKSIEKKIQDLSLKANIDNKKHILVNIGDYKDLSPSPETVARSFIVFAILFLYLIIHYQLTNKSNNIINHDEIIRELKAINE